MSIWRCLRRAFWPSLIVSAIGVSVSAPRVSLTSSPPHGSLYSLAAEAAGLAVEVEVYGYNTTLIQIPDCAGGTPGRAQSQINLTGNAPDGAIVTRLRYRCRIEHEYLGDLVVRLTNDSGSQEMIWNRVGSSTDDGYDDDPELDGDIYMAADRRWVEETFDGDAINQTWYLDVQDQAEGSVGFIDYFDLWVYYESAPQPSETPAPSLTSTPTRTWTPTRTLTPTRTSTSTRSPTGTPRPSATGSGTATETASSTPTQSDASTSTPTPGPSWTSEPSAMPPPTPGTLDALYLPCILITLR